MATTPRSQNRIRQLAGRRQYDDLKDTEAGPLLTRQLDQVTEKINLMVIVHELPVPTNLTADGFSGGVQLAWDDLSDDLKASLAGARIWRAQSGIDPHTEFKENSNKGVIADLVKTTFYADLTADAEIEFIYWVQNVNLDGLVSDPAGGKLATKSSFNVCASVIPDADTIIIDLDQTPNSYYRILFEVGRATRGLAFKGGKCEQKIIVEMIQSSAGNNSVTYDTKIKFGSDIPSAPVTVIANRRDFLGLIYNATDDKYRVVAWVRNYDGGAAAGVDAWSLQGFLPTDFVFSTTSIVCEAPILGGGDLTTDRTISMVAASSITDGYLTSADWIAFSAGGTGSITLPISESDVTGLTSDLAARALTATQIVCVAPVLGGGNLSTNRTISMTHAASGQDGYLTGADWITFNSKSTLSLPIGEGDVTGLTSDLAGKALKTTQVICIGPLWGGGDLSTNRTISMTLAASGQDGYLSGADWIKFNSKSTVSLPIGKGDVTGLTSDLAAKALSSVQLVCIAPITGGGDLTTNRTVSMTVATSGADGYLAQGDWSTFNAKAPTNNATFTGTTTFPGTTSIASNGKIGIGTAPSADRLHVGGDIRLEGLVTEYFLFGPNGVTEGAVGYAHGTGMMYFATNQTTSMTIDSGGVGISNALKVGGTLSVTGFAGFGLSTPQFPIHVRVAPGQNFVLDNGVGGLRFVTADDGPTKNIPIRFQASEYNFWNNYGVSQIFTILDNGNIGIGAGTPDAPLTVNGYITQINPNGGIRTFGVGSQTAANFECVDFFHNGVIAGIRVAAYGSGVYRDFVISCGGVGAFPATPGITLQFNGGYVLTNILGYDAARTLRIGTVGSGDTIYYSVGRSLGTGFLEFSGTQLGYRGFAFLNGPTGINMSPGAVSPFYVSGLPTTDAGLAPGGVWVDTTGGLNILKIKS